MKLMKDNMAMRRECSLHRQLEIVAADVGAWRELAEYHYRPGRPGAVDKIFAIRVIGNEGELSPDFTSGAGSLSGAGLMPAGCRRYVGECGRDARVTRGRWVGVIVYSMPIPSVAMRNRATNNRYTGFGDRKMGLRLLNLEMRWISRVVIHPQYRGMGLARRLVAETLGRAGTILVEAMAAMGRVNPFFERAGMERYEGVQPERSVRLIEAFERVGIEQEQLYDREGLSEVIGNLGEAERRFIDKEMGRFMGGFRHQVVNKDNMDIEGRYILAVQQVMIKPVYYLWRRL